MVDNHATTALITCYLIRLQTLVLLDGTLNGRPALTTGLLALQGTFFTS